MNCRDAIRRVLEEAGEPLHYGEISKRALESGYWTSTGSTPWDSVNALISSEIKFRGGESVFVRKGPGIYALRSLAGGPSKTDHVVSEGQGQEIASVDENDGGESVGGPTDFAYAELSPDDAVQFQSQVQKAEKYLSQIRDGELVLPRFQRMEQWGHKKVASFLESVVEGFPGGTTLLVRIARQEDPPFAVRFLSGAPKRHDKAEDLLLDGQQRLTALWRALRDDYFGAEEDGTISDGHQFFYKLSPEAEESRIHSRLRYHYDGEKIGPLWCNKPHLILKRGLVPCRLLNPLFKASEVGRWVDMAFHDSGLKGESLYSARRGLERLILSLRDRVEDYEIPFIRIMKGGKWAIIDTFKRVNSGTPLKAFDFLVASMEAQGVNLRQMLDTLRSRAPALECYLPDFHPVRQSAEREKGDFEILRGAALALGLVQSEARILELKAGELDVIWPRLTRGFQSASELLQQEGVPDQERNPYPAVLPILAACVCGLPEGGLENTNTLSILRTYVWRAFLSDRYIGAVLTKGHADFRGLEERLKGIHSAPLPIEESRLPNLEIIRNAGWPKKIGREARAMLWLSMCRGKGLDLYDGMPISHHSAKKREYHHLFPKDWLSKHVADADPNLAMNCALIARKTNRQISNLGPQEYLMRVLNRTKLDDEVRKRLESHLIPWEPLMDEDYRGFIDARASMLFQEMRLLLPG